MAYRLLTPYFRSSNPARQDELDLCLQLNCTAFDSVTVLAEGVPFVPSWFGHRMQGRFWYNMQRPTYADVIGMANTQAGRDDFVIIANVDIVMPRVDVAAFHELREDEVFALSRWDITSSGIRIFDKVYSQDVWAFRGPPKQNIGGEYYFGVPGCDNRFAHELDAAGYKVLNPSHDIRAYHLHLSGHRPNNRPENRVAGPYLFVAPHKLGEKPRYRRPNKESKRASQFQV